jgi:hypothetical protein
MSLIEQLKTKRQIKSIWDLGRFLLALVMGCAGIYLLSSLILVLFNITTTTPLQIRVFCYLPFVPFACLLVTLLFEIFQRLSFKCKNEWDFCMIMLSFSLAGMFIMPVRKFIFGLLGFTVKTPLWIKILVYIPIIPPTYYVGLMIFGTILGQHTFFWGMIQKRIKFLTGRKNIKH